MCSAVQVDFFHQYLSTEETNQICEQLHQTWRRDRQVMWSGVPRSIVQQWADAREMQTLTTAMGPLMVHDNPLCLQRHKSKLRWSKYMKGASALFAYHIAQGEKVTVLTPPPKVRFNPHGGTNYQAIEEPILKGAIRDLHVEKIELVHPTVPGASDFRYQMWPKDEVDSWILIFGEPGASVESARWRHPKPNRPRL